MNDIETNLDILVRSIVDEASAKNAPKKITKLILGALKDGYIEIPATISTDEFKNDKIGRKLKKAQTDFLTQWKKMSNEGFSSSEEELDSFVKKYTTYRKLLNKHAPDSQQNAILTSLGLNNVMQNYTKAMKQAKVMTNKLVAGINTEVEKGLKNTSGKNKKRYPVEIIKKASEQWLQEVKGKRFKGKIPLGPNRLGSRAPIGLPTNVGIDAGRTDDRSSRLSEFSGHPSRFASMQAKDKRNAYSKEKESLETQLYVTQKELNAEIEKRHQEDKIQGKNKNNFTGPELAKQLRISLTKNVLPTYLKTLQTSEDSTETRNLQDQIFNTLDTISKLNKKAGDATFKEVLNTIDITMKKLGFTTFGKIGGTEGGDKTAKSYDPKIVDVLQGFFEKVVEKEDEINKELTELTKLQDKEQKRKTYLDIKSEANKLIAAVNSGKNLDELIQVNEKQYTQAKSSNVADRVDSAKEKQINESIKDTTEQNKEINLENAKTGTDTDKKTNELIEAAGHPDLSNIGDLFKDMMCPCETVLQEILAEIRSGLTINRHPKQVGTKQTSFKTDTLEGWLAKTDQIIENSVERLREKLEFVPKKENNISEFYGSKTQEEIERLRAQRLSTYGFSDSTSPLGIGDKLQIYRRKLLWGKATENPFANLKLTDSMNDVDINNITKALQDTIQKNMFSAQTGGGFKNVIGAAFGYLGMPSLEKSRAEADAANQMMANIRDIMQDMLQDILTKESDLRGLQKEGKGSSDEAMLLSAQLEERKLALRGTVADMAAFNDELDQADGKLSKFFKKFMFLSPELRSQNKIISNINSGLDKNGKALKFQKRTAEVLNYSFQLMARNVGQMWKRWMLQLNPITQIRKAFQDFMSYDIKWQRTMNVIKYNIRAILKPFMQWLAQSFVNVIGFVDIISQKIQKAFGNVPISLFDQTTANMEKMAEELQNVTAGFDELHDIGSDNTGANDLFGEIYKPQLSKEWEDIANNIGDIVGNISKFISENWTALLNTLLGIFLGWKLLKIAGPILLKALTGDLSTGLFGANGLFGKIGNAIGKVFGKELYTGMNGSTVTLGKLAGGLTLVAGGTLLATKNAEALGKNWQDLNSKQQALGVGFSGLASGAAGLGAVMLGASGPVGWAVAGGVALGSLLIGMAQTQDGLKSLEEETKALAEAQQIAQLANDNYLISLDNLTITVENLEKIERETGLSGKALAEQVKNGELAIENMTSAQLRCYNAYVKNEEMIKQNKKAIEEKTEADKNAMLQALRVEAVNAKEAQSYEILRDKVVKAWEDQVISATEAGEILSRTLASADRETQQVFGENIPNEILECYNPKKYESGMRKFGDAWTNFWSGISNWWNGLWSGISDWWNGLWGNHTSSSTVTVPKYEQGTNYVPNNGLAYLHQGEAVIPRKYNQPYQQGMSSEERMYLQQMMNTMRSLDNTMKEGINVNGEFRQRGSDLVAVVNKTNSQTGSDLLSNVSYAR